MLIVPGAAAHLLTDRLPSMLVVSLVFAAVSAVLGHIAAITVPTWFGFADTSTAGMMALMAGLLFGVVMLVAPRYGVLSKLFHRAALSIKIAAEDILGLLYRLEERRQGHPVVQTANDLHALIQAGPLTGRLAILRLNRSGSIRSTREGYGLTNQGRGEAQRIIRAHRLWEGYLSEHLRLPGDHLHSPAEGLEHITSEQMQAQLAAAQGRPEIDPQGKPIPPESQR
jgi:manganese/zinc/iron transport system permease protein